MLVFLTSLCNRYHCLFSKTHRLVNSDKYYVFFHNAHYATFVYLPHKAETKCQMPLPKIHLLFVFCRSV